LVCSRVVTEKREEEKEKITMSNSRFCQLKQYGGPSKLHVTNIGKPSIVGDDEILIRIKAASINSADWRIMRADPFLIRLMFGLRSPSKLPKGGIGADIAGVVEATSSNVKQFKAGDAVYGDLSSCGFGGFADYVVVSETAALANKPSSISFEEAASLPMASLTALEAIKDVAKVSDGDQVVIHGAGGGVGSMAVQIAKAYGGHVTAVCNTKKVQKMKDIGADIVVDYTKEDFTKMDQKFDVIIDCGAYHSVWKMRKALKPTGHYVVIGGTFRNLLRSMFYSPFLSHKGGQTISVIENKPTRAGLDAVRDLVESDKLKPVIDKKFSLDHVVDAMTFFEEGKPTGKVIVTMTKDDE